jgi:anthranilate synthase component 1
LLFRHLRACLLWHRFSGYVPLFSTLRRSAIAASLRPPVAGRGVPFFVRHGGIVADSVPELEYQESLNKAKAVMRAIERAREM